jgi:hypothetical protein
MLLISPAIAACETPIERNNPRTSGLRFAPSVNACWRVRQNSCEYRDCTSNIGSGFVKIIAGPKLASKLQLNGINTVGAVASVSLSYGLRSFPAGSGTTL